jgi:hypothetical protein
VQHACGRKNDNQPTKMDTKRDCEGLRENKELRIERVLIVGDW